MLKYKNIASVKRIAASELRKTSNPALADEVHSTCFTALFCKHLLIVTDDRDKSRKAKNCRSTLPTILNTPSLHRNYETSHGLPSSPTRWKKWPSKSRSPTRSSSSWPSHSAQGNSLTLKDQKSSKRLMANSNTL